MNNNQYSNKNSAGTNAAKAIPASNKFETEFAGDTDVQAAKLERAYVEAKENQKDDQ